MRARKTLWMLRAPLGMAVAVALATLSAGGVSVQAQTASLEEACAKPPSRADWSANANVMLAQSNVSAAFAARDNATTFAQSLPQLIAALAVCNQVNPAKARAGNVAAYACAAQGGYLVAKYGPPSGDVDGTLKQAFCAYTAVTALAADQAAPERRAMLANAYEGRGGVREARAALNVSRSSVYRADAIDDYIKAAQTQPTPARYLALARAQAAAQRWPQANASYEQLQGLAPDLSAFPNTMRASALREQARVQQRDTASFTPASVRALWERASRLDPSAEAQFEYAKSLFEAGDPGALAAFHAAANARNDSASINYPADASYYSAVIGARSATTGAQWTAVFDDATKAGVGSPRAARMVCVAYIGRGGAALGRDDPAAPCKLVGQDAEGQLLRGMYALRLAQNLPYSCRDPNTGADPCRTAFDATLARYNNEAVNIFEAGYAQASADATFNWLEQPAAQQPKLREALDFGRKLANTLRARSGCRAPYPSDGTPAADVFRRLDLLGCKPTN